MTRLNTAPHRSTQVNIGQHRTTDVNTGQDGSARGNTNPHTTDRKHLKNKMHSHPPTPLAVSLTPSVDSLTKFEALQKASGSPSTDRYRKGEQVCTWTGPAPLPAPAAGFKA